MINLDWKVENGFNCYIDLHPACNAACPFCIAPTVDRKSGPLFWDGMEFALGYTAKAAGTIQIVGGEPTISNRLIPLLNRLSDFRIRRTVLNTNGSNLFGDVLDACRVGNVSHINVSRHHYDDNKNQEIMRFRSQPVSKDALVSIVTRVRERGHAIRLQANLISGYIDRPSEMIEYLRWCKAMGVFTVSFSQVFPLSQFDYQTPLSTYDESSPVDLVDIVGTIDRDDRFVQKPGPVGEGRHPGGSTTAWGTSRRRYFEFEGVTFSIKTLIGYDKYKLPRMTPYVKADDPELREGLVSFAVVHSDGRVTASWDRRERVMYDPELIYGGEKAILPILAGVC